MNNIVKAASYIGKKIYSQPYPNTKGSLGRFSRKNFHYKCADGTVIHRPNHNIANRLRTLTYLQPVIRYYAINGNDEIKKNLTLIDEDEIEKIRYILLFYTSYRKNELNFSDRDVRVGVLTHLTGYFKSCESLFPFKDSAEVKYYTDLLRTDPNGLKQGKDKIISLLLHSCHNLDLLRCYPENKLKNSLFMIFNENSKQKNTRNLQSLIFYAQNCIIATGDKLRTKYQVQAMDGSHHQQGFHLHLRTSKTRLTQTGNNSIAFCGKSYNELLFKRASQVDEKGVSKTLQDLEKIPKPLFFPDMKSNDVYTAEKSLELIKQGNSVIRIINGNVDDISLRFEFEQLLNPNFMRPLRKSKLNKGHTEYYDLATRESVTRPEKDYIEISQQKPITNSSDIPPYKNDRSISRPADRGKPKSTIFSKKQSHSLLPPNGLFPMFNGRFKDRIASVYVPVGMLYDLKKMHHKGERYVWPDDARTSGISGYFWLNKEKESSFIPNLDTVRYDQRCSIASLKKALQTNDVDKFNEMLMGASLDSLNALFAPKDQRLHRLAVLHANILLSRDYGIIRPLLIIDGKSEPKEYLSRQIQADLTQAIKKYRKWYWRLLHNFITTKEHQVLLEIAECISPKNLRIIDYELIRHFIVDKRAIPCPNKRQSASLFPDGQEEPFLPSVPQTASYNTSTECQTSIENIKQSVAEINQQINPASSKPWFFPNNTHKAEKHSASIDRTAIDIDMESTKCEVKGSPPVKGAN